MKSYRSMSNQWKCLCGTRQCRGNYVSTSVIPRKKTTSSSTTSTKTAYASPILEYKIKKFVEYMCRMSKSQRFISWEYVSKDSWAAKRYLSCMGKKSFSYFQCSSFINKHKNRIKSLLKANGKKMSFTQLGFTILSLNSNRS